MEKCYKKGLFIFRRDLRLADNLGLLSLLRQTKTVVLAFIFDPQQIEARRNNHFSAPAFYFLLNSLDELAETVHTRGGKLFVLHGNHADVVANLIEKDEIDAVFVNKDYTPFSRKRDKAIADVCKKRDVVFERHDDVTLSPVETIRTKQQGLYTVFTPFMKRASAYEVPVPQKNNFSNYFSGKLKTTTKKLNDFTAHLDIDPVLHGGREEGLRFLHNLARLKNYKTNRNFPAEHGTSRLSAHHKIGTISIRETYHTVKKHEGLGSQFVSELYWRDFYYYIAYHFPTVFTSSFLPWAKNIIWVNDKKQFRAWCEGKTGVPMVDAGMRELNTTGWMHNRSRMIVASYLTKNLLIDWRWGERYFATKLIDYDPCQNNGGWQWSASVGADPRPLRIFNPYTQAKKYDPEATYIQKWVPELCDVDTELLVDGKTQNFNKLAPNYPSPLVDQKESYRRAQEVYKKAKERTTLATS